ncbi:MAG: tetratricopeptide repeat protein [Oscillatoriales cyanobacterium C42_A2020_001]|nr:tetratricopeptide repeat protein [Leptolyngbyaceae cyanobacterium C42_A2020_001]
MKSNQRSLFSQAGTLPMSAVLLFFAPTVASAQTVVTPPAATSAETGNPTQAEAANPITPAITAGTPVASPTLAATAIAPTSTPTAAPIPYVYPVASQVPYPVAAPVYSTVPIQASNPGGFTVQVTTQIGIPNQSIPNQGGYPLGGMPTQITPGTGIVYPGVQGLYPAGMPTQAGYLPAYSSGVYTPSPTPIAPVLPANTGGFVEAISNPALLPWSAQTLWQQIVSNPTQANSQTIATLQQMLREYPNFIPAYTQLAQALIANNRPQEAIATLERGTTLYPNQPELARSLIIALGNSQRWNEAAMSARQFAIRNPNSPLVSEFTKLADESIKLAQTPSSSGTPVRGGVLSNLLTTGLGYLLTGKVSPSVTSGQTPWSSIVPGDAAAGSQMAQELLSQVQLLNDPDVTNYINDIGRKLAQASGRSDFQFYVVKDAGSGAIALPNNQIFVSAGSIANTNSEAELAALIARQMGHSVLSHPSKIARRGNITSTIARLLPTVGGLVSPKIRDFNNSTTGTLVSGLIGSLGNGLLKQNYTSQMVNDATKTGTKLLDAAGYGSGSLLNISMGSDRHAQMKVRVQQLLGTAQPWWSLGR